MKERPIIFSGPMVRAMLEGRKTMTRRVIKPQPSFPAISLGLGSKGNWVECWRINGSDFYPGDTHYCPYGQPGETRLYVRETHYRYGKWIKKGLSETGRQKWKFKALTDEVLFDPPERLATRPGLGWYKRPSIFMPKWASRITLELTGVRVERVQEISEDDALNEGSLCADHIPYIGSMTCDQSRFAFQLLWDSINGKKPGCSWDDNPWCWVLEFKRA
jgi:hypothetical protein